MSKKGARGRWNPYGIRFSPARMIEDSRFVCASNNYGKRRWRLKEDEVSETDWIERRKSRPEFHRGARIWSRATIAMHAMAA